MKQRITYFLRYYLFCLIFFWFLKALFILYHFDTYSNYRFKELLNVFVYGTRLDLSFSGYMAILPALLLAFSNFFKGMLVKKIIKWYSLIILPVICLIAIVDIEIFKTWGFRIDTTVLKYMNTPKEVVASIWSSPIVLLVALLIASVFISCLLFLKFLYHKEKAFAKGGIIENTIGFVVMLLLGGLLILPIRGGLQLAPINQSSVYFSNDQYLNQAAINAPWNLSYSLIENNHNEDNPFLYQTEEEVAQRMAKLYTEKDSTFSRVLKKPKTNVILIIWESFTAKTVESLGGEKGITPQFNQLISEGIFFDNFYASGDRSDKGLIAVLSSFPAQSITSIMRKTNKAAKLPSLSRTYKNNGYTTSFYYGGEPEFANIKSYLINSKYDKLVTKEHFAPETWNSKWGAHDDVVFDKLFNDLHESRQPFFSTIFTLSSHEPFEVPVKPFLPGKDEATLFLNSIHYTDSCLGDFIQRAKKEVWWDNTVIIITADHGHRLPGNMVTHLPEEFKVPMLWLGGALTKKDTVIHTIASQTDISATLLKQTGIDPKDFSYSRNLLTDNPPSFAYYAYKNGFGYITPSGKLVFDNISKNFLLKDSTVTAEDIKNGKAYLQFSFQDYLNK